MFISVSIATMGSSAFDKLFDISVPHVLEKIFLSLDYRSYKACFEVSPSWKELLTSEPCRRKAKSLFEIKISQDHQRLWAYAWRGDKYEVWRLVSTAMFEINRSSRIYHSSPIYAAASKGHKIVAEYLLGMGADPNIIQFDASRIFPGHTALHRAASCGHYNTVKLLLDNGADINASYLSRIHSTTDREWTPLHNASHNGRKGVVQLLLKRGAMPDHFCIYLADINGFRQVVEILKNHMANR